MADAKTFWGWVTELGVGIPVVVAAAPVAMISGAISAARGDTFDEGYDKIGDAVTNFAERAGAFGDQYNDTVNGILVNAAVSAAIGGVAGKVGEAASRRSGPPKAPHAPNSSPKPTPVPDSRPSRYRPNGA